MTDEAVPPVERFVELPHETQMFLSELSHEDIATIKNGLPIIRLIIDFGKVTKWLAITALGIIAGFVLLWESLLKIAGWFKVPPH